MHEAQYARVASISNAGEAARISTFGDNPRAELATADMGLCKYTYACTYTYADWNLVQELQSATSGLRTHVYAYDPDRRGTPSRAGFIGFFPASDGSGSHAFYTYDANGHSRSLIGANGKNPANYAYTPYNKTGVSYYGYRYYSTGLGRWVSRDPIEEHAFQSNFKGDLDLVYTMDWKAIGFLNENRGLYCFIANSPNNKIDLLGLAASPCCQCGQNVDTAIGVTMINVLFRWSNLRFWQRVRACLPIMLPIANFGNAWDMNMLLAGLPCNPPTDPKCKRTVSLGGKCYDRFDVNYYLYGWASKKCGASSLSMDARIIAWKTYKRDFERIPGALAFANLGFSFLPPPLLLPPEISPIGYPDCGKCEKTYSGLLDATWPPANP